MQSAACWSKELQRKRKKEREHHPGKESRKGDASETNEHKFATLVFMDMETTGLIVPGNNPKITELCMISVQREDFLENASTPRVTNKLLLCFNPVKGISQKASELTGLHNDSLRSQHIFCPETVQLINSILQLLPQPVCLLAHSGSSFDFPILKAELNEINQSLKSTIFCADTLEAFRITSEDRRVSYSLEKIYERTFGEPPPISHTAEDDCLSLLKVTQSKGQNILSWVDRNAVCFSTISPAY